MHSKEIVQADVTFQPRLWVIKRNNGAAGSREGVSDKKQVKGTQ